MPCYIWIATCYLKDEDSFNWESKASREQKPLQLGWAALLGCGKQLGPGHNMSHPCSDRGGQSATCLSQTTYFCFPHPGASPQTTAPSLGLFGRWTLPFEKEADTFLPLSFDVPSVALVLLPASWVQVPYQWTLGGWVVFLMGLVGMFSEAEGSLLILAWRLSLEEQKQKTASFIQKHYCCDSSFFAKYWYWNAFNSLRNIY